MRSHGCWAAPHEIEWLNTIDPDLEIKRENLTGVVTVFRKGNRNNALWGVAISGFSGLFSETVITGSGTLLVHIRSNHQVSKLEDVAVEVFHRDGGSVQFNVKDFIDQLIKTPDERCSTDPDFRWMKGSKFTKTSAIITNAKGVQKELLFSELEERLLQHRRARSARKLATVTTTVVPEKDDD